MESDLDGRQEKVCVVRHQLPKELAFAVTDHSAQGKTLPMVLLNLHEGGFAACIGALHTKSREGLSITKCVDLQDLNKPLPTALRSEACHLQVLEHNTLI